MGQVMHIKPQHTVSSCQKRKIISQHKWMGLWVVVGGRTILNDILFINIAAIKNVAQ